MSEKKSTTALKMLVDSSVLIALYCSKDTHHEKAKDIFEISKNKRIEWILCDVVFFEAANRMKGKIYGEKGKTEKEKSETVQKTIKQYIEKHEWDNKINIIYPKTYPVAMPIFNFFTMPQEKFQMNDCILYLFSITTGLDGIITFDDGFKNRQINVYSSSEELAAI